MAALSEEDQEYILNGLEFCERQAEFLHGQIKHYKEMLKNYIKLGDSNA